MLESSTSEYGGGRGQEFYSPHRTGPGNRLVATVFEVQRIPPEGIRWPTADGSAD